MSPHSLEMLNADCLCRGEDFCFFICHLRFTISKYTKGIAEAVFVFIYFNYSKKKIIHWKYSLLVSACILFSNTDHEAWWRKTKQIRFNLIHKWLFSWKQLEWIAILKTFSYILIIKRKLILLSEKNNVY